MGKVRRMKARPEVRVKLAELLDACGALFPDRKKA